MTAQKWVSRVGALATIVVLTRILTPEDFGLAAAASALLPLVYVLSDVGFSTYIVQAAKLEQRTLSTAFWFSLASGGVLALVILGAAPFMGMLLNLPEVADLLRVLTLSVVAIAVGSVPLALMRRRLSFRSLAFMEATGAIVAQVAAISAALAGLGAWALVIQLMLSQMITTIWVWFAAKWTPTWQFSKRDFLRMGVFGTQVIGSGLVAVIREWLETAIVVAGLGVREMGYLNIAQRLVLTAQDLTASALLPVSMSAFAKVRESPERLRSSYLRASTIAYSAVMPLMVVVAVTAPVLVPFLFGSEKSFSAEVTPALSVLVLLGLGVFIDQGLHLGAGRPARWFVFVLVGYSLAVAVTAGAVRYGLIPLVLAWVGVAVVDLVGRWFLVGTLLKVTPWNISAPLLGALVPTTVAAAVGVGLMHILAGQTDVLVLATTGLGVLAAYLGTMRVFRLKALQETLAVVPGPVARPVAKLLRVPRL